VRTAERKTGLTWDHIRGVMQRLHLIEFFSKDGRVLQTTEPIKKQFNIFKLLKISPPKRMQDIQMSPKNVGTRPKNESFPNDRNDSVITKSLAYHCRTWVRITFLKINWQTVT